MCEIQTGDIVRSRLPGKDTILGLVIDIIVPVIEDEECVKWEYNDIAKVLYPGGLVEINPVELYIRVDKNDLLADIYCQDGTHKEK